MSTAEAFESEQETDICLADSECLARLFVSYPSDALT